MKAQLQEIRDCILASSQSDLEKSVELIALSEKAFMHGDMSAYSELMDEVVKMNPQYQKPEADSVSFKFNKSRVADCCLPDIDFDESSTEEVKEYVSQKTKGNI